MKKILITDAVHDDLIQAFEQAGFTCHYVPNTTDSEVRKIIHNYKGLIVNSKINVDRQMIDLAQRLEFVGRLGSGMEIIDKVYAESKGIKVCNSPEGNRNAVAEHALGMLLALSNQLLRGDSEVRQKIWEREARRGFELNNKVLGIIGFGHTGSTFARKLAGLGVRVLAFDKYQSVQQQIERLENAEKLPEDGTLSPPIRIMSHVEAVESLDPIFAQADIVSLHLPLTAETKHLVNQDFLAQFRKKIVLLNTSRGKIVKTIDLVTALEQGKIIGACLDVFENEKVSTFTDAENQLYERLYQLPNVILSPHVAGWTHESKQRMATVLVEKILGRY